MPKWKDTTSYSRDKEKIPTTWTLEIPGCHVLVHRFMGSDGWYGTCHELNESRRNLSAPFLEEAQEEFLTYLTEKAMRLFKALSKVADS